MPFAEHIVHCTTTIVYTYTGKVAEVVRASWIFAQRPATVPVDFTKAHARKHIVMLLECLGASDENGNRDVCMFRLCE